MSAPGPSQRPRRQTTSDWFDAAGRLRGWKLALEDRDAEVPPVSPADWSAASGYRAGLMLARMPEVTAVFAANDHLALGILRAMHERGRSVPGDVSVVGFDDVPEAAYFIPPLTTVRPDFDKVAAETLSVLLASIAGEEEDEHGYSTRRVIVPTLVERDSVAPPPE
jgi:DNA-binding LacI/PurR family transcriptional regulator